ncbi:MAG: hypothetical protein WBG90_20455 [Saonia sp.]
MLRKRGGFRKKFIDFE